MFKKLFMPLGMITAVAAALIWPPCGIWIKTCDLNNFFIIVIFSVCGLQTKTDGVKFSGNFALSFIAGAAITLFLSPFLALFIARVMRLPDLPLIGLVVASAVPPTLSSGVVMTSIAGGNTFFAMLITIGYNLLGVVTMPLVISWCFADSGKDINTDPWKMLLNLFLLVVLPFASGFLFKRFVKKLPEWSGYIPSVCIFFLLLSFFSGSADELKSFPLNMFFLTAAGSLFMHTLLLLIMWHGGKLMKVGSSDRKALLFTGASKTMTIALTLLSIIGADDGTAVAPCMVFYFLQMLIDSALAVKMGSAVSMRGNGS